MVKDLQLWKIHGYNNPTESLNIQGECKRTMIYKFRRGVSTPSNAMHIQNLVRCTH